MHQPLEHRTDVDEANRSLAEKAGVSLLEVRSAAERNELGKLVKKIAKKDPPRRRMPWWAW